jgi:A/G-specific adenine glycosylase
MIQELCKNRLVAWWRKNRRDFGWRECKDPYIISITEIMLIRTKAKQVEPVWRDFIIQFPDIYELAGAPEEKIQEKVKKLGLRWRARVLRQFAERVIEDFGGVVPTNSDDLKKLLPSGDYMPYAVQIMVKGYGLLPVDVTIARVLNRLYGVGLLGDFRRSRTIRRIVADLGIVQKDFFLAVIDLAEKVCLPRLPMCVKCPIKGFCRYNDNKSGNLVSDDIIKVGSLNG